MVLVEEFVRVEVADRVSENSPVFELPVDDTVDCVDEVEFSVADEDWFVAVLSEVLVELTVLLDELSPVT